MEAARSQNEPALDSSSGLPLLEQSHMDSIMDSTSNMMSCFAEPQPIGHEVPSFEATDTYAFKTPETGSPGSGTNEFDAQDQQMNWGDGANFQRRFSVSSTGSRRSGRELTAEELRDRNERRYELVSNR
jgi:hypothetical protein